MRYNIKAAAAILKVHKNTLLHDIKYTAYKMPSFTPSPTRGREAYFYCTDEDLKAWWWRTHHPHLMPYIESILMGSEIGENKIGNLLVCDRDWKLLKRFKGSPRACALYLNVESKPWQ